MLKKIVLGLLAVVLLAVGVFAAVVAMQPADFRIERSETMAAPPADVFAQVNDFNNWQDWSPWAKLDTKATNSFEGPSSGEGAIFKWSGNDDVGQGDMTITESRPNELIKIKLHFIRPMEGTNVTEFTFKPAGDKTLVTWAMSGQNGFVGRAFCLVMNMQKVVGDEFSKGLATMKGIVETKSTEPKTTEEKATEAKS
jgi:carbon monoxide dehydrogenase subunit G